MVYASDLNVYPYDVAEPWYAAILSLIQTVQINPDGL